MDWTASGGGLMLFNIPSQSGYLELMREQIGIVGMDEVYVVVNGLHFCRPFMLGGELRDYGITDPYESSVPVLLDSQSEVYLQSTGEDPTPLLWRRPVGEGTAVVVNLDFADKIYRGFYASAYSLLGDGFAWPVINGATFYIDDFPAPVPQGDDKHISKDYNMSVRDFMTQIWWTDVQQLALDHGIRYTGLVIEQYSDQTEAPLPANDDLNRYYYFGRSLLDMGGEIGFHGYNHMPLVLKNFDYRGEYDEYTPWASMADMVAGVSELDRFCSALYPGESFQVYVPPSNILSDEGRAMLHEKFPQIKAVASTYLADGVCYDQEFEVAEDGVVETPRVISGYIMSDFVYLSAVARLGSYVNHVPYMLTEHGIYTREREEEIIRAKWVLPAFKRMWVRFFYMLSSGAYAKASMITSLFERARQMQIDMGCPPDRCRYIVNGVHFDRFCDIPYKKPDGWTDIGAVLRIAPIKDIKTMLYAFADLKQRVPNVRLHVCGPEDDPEYAQECYDLVEHLRLQDVEFPGTVNVLEKMQEFDFTILTSISEGQPLSVLESFAAGRPCVTTDVGCCKELIGGMTGDRLGPAGLCVPPMHREAISGAMEYLCTHPEERYQMGRVGKERVQEHFRHRDMVSNYLEAYEEVFARWQESDSV